MKNHTAFPNSDSQYTNKTVMFKALKYVIQNY